MKQGNYGEKGMWNGSKEGTLPNPEAGERTLDWVAVEVERQGARIVKFL